MIRGRGVGPENNLTTCGGSGVERGGRLPRGTCGDGCGLDRFPLSVDTETRAGRGARPGPTRAPAQLAVEPRDAVRALPGSAEAGAPRAAERSGLTTIGGGSP